MNNTKWNEIYETFYENECNGNMPVVRWRTKDSQNGFVSRWDGTWTHFGCEPRDWERIDYLQIELSKENEKFVIEQLKRIHVPGIVSAQVVTIYGYKQNIDYII